jgi:NAD(P)-dependent dehydrogenase (short-subunit alcohol dehydrogenase family)
MAVVNLAGLKETVNAIKSPRLVSFSRIEIFTSDISSSEYIASLFSHIPSLDYTVNCARALGESNPTAEVDVDEFDRVNRMNCRGMWMCVKEELNLMFKNELKSYNDLSFRQTKHEYMANEVPSLTLP